jgi:pyruvate/2-oxoacid:ferredoxin oxidoreductase alpha subunit
VVLADGNIGQMMEPVRFADPIDVPAPPAWAVRGTAATRANLVSSIFLEPEKMERHVQKLEAKYRQAEREAVRSESYRTEDAEFVLIGYGIMGRILKAVVDHGRERGHKLGLLRPLTLYPFPGDRIRELAARVKGFLVAELSVGQLRDDVRLALEGRRPVEFFGRTGGVVPTAEEVLAAVEQRFALQEVLVHG